MTEAPVPPSSGSFLRDNAFILAAILLPLVVIGFFLISTAIPRWTVPPPAYDLVLRAGGPYDASPRIAVDYGVRGGKVEATVRPIAPNAYPQRSTLFLFEHATMSMREIAVVLPDVVKEGEAPPPIVVEALANRRVIAPTQAPDGYQLELRPRRGPGLVGELFGMNRYDQGLALVNRGRVVPITLPAPHQYLAPVQAVGWLANEGVH